MSIESHPLWEAFGGLPLQQKWKLAVAFFSALASAFLLGYGIGTWFQSFHVQRLELELENLRQSTLSTPRQSVRISSPNQDSHVGQFTNVVGSCSKVGRFEIWVSIYSHSLKRYFPARTEARRTGETGWITEQVEIGTEADPPSSKFDIAVFLVDPDSTALSNYLNAPAAEGFPTPLGGMYEQDRITVYRE